jgi:hypothetical protein
MGGPYFVSKPYSHILWVPYLTLTVLSAWDFPHFAKPMETFVIHLYFTTFRLTFSFILFVAYFRNYQKASGSCPPGVCFFGIAWYWLMLVNLNLRIPFHWGFIPHHLPFCHTDIGICLQNKRTLPVASPYLNQLPALPPGPKLILTTCISLLPVKGGIHEECALSKRANWNRKGWNWHRG